MRKKLFKAFCFVFVGTAIVLILYNVCILVIRKYGTSDLETRKFNMLISGNNVIDPEMELLHTLQWYSNWDYLFLTDNFKNKFKKRENILHDIDVLEDMSVCEGYEYNYEGKVIGISGYKKKNLLEMINPNYIGIYRVYFFKYQVDENGYLDDVELVGQQDFDAETGFPIGVDDSNYHTIS